MYLKRLEIFGFKTFAEKTEILFTPDVTAVIGPNGSGKSNGGCGPLGAGRAEHPEPPWEHLPDVIFAGNERRKPLGMAEVSLTIDNSTRILPLEFAEVTVTRRVYPRGGRFFINRVPCRLRDIYELFLDTGIGRDAYSFVNQSEIDAILSVRAEDRRAIFEEAAGIKVPGPEARGAQEAGEYARKPGAGERHHRRDRGPARAAAAAGEVARRHRSCTAGCESWSRPGHSATLRRPAMESDRLAGLIGDLNTERERLEQLDGVRAEEADRRSAPSMPWTWSWSGCVWKRRSRRVR